MKFLNLFTIVFLCAAAFFGFSSVAFAQVAPQEGFEWLPALIGMLNGIPAVGKYLAIAFQVAAVTSASLTALVVFLETILKIPEVAARWAGAEDLADKIEEFKNKVLPWIKYFSMYNVQKK